MSWLHTTAVVLLAAVVLLVTASSWSACRIPGHCRYHTRHAPDPPPPMSWLERVSPQAASAEIYFPTLVAGNGLETYPPLTWPQPWLDPVSSMYWPKLIDIDRTPFVAWERRIGQ